MVFSSQRASLRHLLALLYILTAALLGSLLIHERRSDEPLFTLSHASAKELQNTATVSVYGEAFKPGVRAVHVKKLVNEEALLWQSLAGISSNAVDVSGDLVLVACSTNKLVSLGFHDNKKPEILSSVELPDTVRHVKIIGDKALVAMGRHAGLALIDLHDPVALEIVKLFPRRGLVTAMVAERDIVYFTDTFLGVGRIDLSSDNPTPEILASVKTPWRIALQGRRLVVGSVKGSVLLFDIAQQGELVEVGRIDYPVNVRGIAFVDETLVVALADDTFHVLSQSSWPDLQNIAQIKLPGSPIRIERVPGQGSVAVSLVAGGLAMIDLSRPSLPVLTGILKRPRTFTGGKVQPKTFFGVSQVGLEIFSLDKIVSGDYASLATESVIDHDYYKLVSWNNHVYGFNKSHTVDFGEKTSTVKGTLRRFMAVLEEEGVGFFARGENDQIVRVDSLAIEGARDVIYRGEYLYVLSQKGLHIYSGTRPEELVRIGELKLSGEPKSFELLDSGHMLVVTHDPGVIVVDVNDPQLPVQIASVTLPLHRQPVNIVQDIVADGQQAYLTLGDGGVYVVDMSSPDRPELIQLIDTPGLAQQMALYDGLLLVGDGNEGLFMVDVADHNQALPIGSLPTPIRMDQLAVVNDGLIVSSHSGGTLKLPLPRRIKHLSIVNEGELGVEVEKIEKGQHLYIYDEKESQQVRIEM